MSSIIMNSIINYELYITTLLPKNIPNFQCLYQFNVAKMLSYRQQMSYFLR